MKHGYLPYLLNETCASKIKQALYLEYQTMGREVSFLLKKIICWVGVGWLLWDAVRLPQCGVLRPVFRLWIIRWEIGDLCYNKLLDAF